MNFADLLKRASSNTAQQQAEHAKQEKERQAAKKATEEAGQRRQAELRRLAEERRKEREERERKEKEQEARKARALPKTTNLWALKKERQRLGLYPDGKDDHLIEGAALDQATKPKSYKELLAHANSAAKASATSSSNGKGKAKEKEPVVLSRAERAQRKQAALFNDDEPSSGAFALAKARKRSDDYSSTTARAAPSIPALKRTASTDSAWSSRPGSPAVSSTARARSSKGSASATAGSRSSSSSIGKAAATIQGSAKDRIAAQLEQLMKAPQKLNVVKRDTRTIEEIERDMRARKAKENGTAVEITRSIATSGPPIGSRPLATGNRVRTDTAIRTAPAKGVPAVDRKTGRRPHSPSYSDSDSFSDSSSSERPARKRSRNSSGLREDQRSAIWKLMGRDRNRDIARERELGSDDSDMEATGEDVLREERQAARLAAREDAAEQARERKRAEEKAKRKLAQTGKS
ncbi:hypothetical protein JCM10908_005381 [Rhodotorula pacifica]|uniref:Spt2p n=1 Tax=Rhodotorula pacifica TaxID=1495444 RepID=UPI00316C402D